MKMTGWGSDSAMTPFSPFMKEHSLNLESTAKCGAMLNNEHVTIDESFVCSAGNFGSAVCFGDSGGPLQLMNPQDVTNAHPIIIGVVNFGVPCGLGRPDAFARISYFKDWINDVLHKMASTTSGGRVLSAANVVNPWTSPSLEAFLEPDDMSKLREGQSFRCLGDSSVYQYINGLRYKSIQGTSASLLVDCKFIPAGIEVLLKQCYYERLEFIQTLFSDNPDVDINATDDWNHWTVLSYASFSTYN